ncbi:hypothetical protein YPD27_3824 [Yersinia pestis KIM D27]|nr:hypothetical protein YPD27_3824 [Yersinia pestis KIM D27]
MLSGIQSASLICHSSSIEESEKIQSVVFYLISVLIKTG